VRLWALLLGLAAAAGAEDRVDQRIPMRDGKALASDIFLPEKPGKYPTVLIQTPYSRKRTSPLGGLDLKRANIYDREHYAYVIVDWRGFYGSKDASVGRPERGKDGFDCVEWIAAQPWSDGKVGTYGGSALASQQFLTALEHPPHLVCCVPMIQALGQTYDRYYPGGVWLEAHSASLTRLGFGGQNLVRSFPLPHQPAWKLAERTTYRPGELKVPMLLITGWWDHYPDAVLQTWRDVAGHTESRLLIGPWDHMGVDVAQQGAWNFEGAAGAAADAARAFFDFWLRGIKENGWEKTARIRYWRVGEQGFRDAAAWPPGESKPRTFDLCPGPRTFTYDPKDPPPTLGGANLPPLPHGPTDHTALEQRKDLLVFRTPPMEEALTFEGNVEVEIAFSCDRVDCDLAVWLCDATPGGASVLLTEGIQRAKLRDPAAVRLLEPGQPCRLTVKLPALAATVAKGRELRVYLSGGNSPRYERNTHTGADHFDAAAALPVTVTVAGLQLAVPYAAWKPSR